MTKLDLPYDLANKTPADANPVETNFNRTELHINQELIERDGSVAMRAALRLANSTPVDPLDAASKGYVDLRGPQTAVVAGAGLAVLATYSDLTGPDGVGPTVSLATGVYARVTVGATMSTLTAADTALMSFEISGASSQAAPVNGTFATHTGAVPTFRFVTTIVHGLTPGTNIFQAKYTRIDNDGGGASGLFSNRFIVVEKLD